jgi:hypothetical protein
MCLADCVISIIGPMKFNIINLTLYQSVPIKDLQYLKNSLFRIVNKQSFMGIKLLFIHKLL